MGGIVAAVGGVFGVALLFVVVYWIRGLLVDRATLTQRDGELRGSEQQVDAMERAAAADRVKRAEEFDVKAAQVRTADDAARLLREQLSKARRPGKPVQGPGVA